MKSTILRRLKKKGEKEVTVKVEESLGHSQQGLRVSVGMERFNSGPSNAQIIKRSVRKFHEDRLRLSRYYRAREVASKCFESDESIEISSSSSFTQMGDDINSVSEGIGSNTDRFNLMNVLLDKIICETAEGGLEEFLSLTFLIEQSLFYTSSWGFMVKLYLILIGLYTVHEITIIKIIVLEISGKCNIVPDNLYRFLKRILEYLSEPEYEVVNVLYSEESGIVVYQRVTIRSTVLKDQLLADREGHYMKNIVGIIHSLLQQRLVTNGSELFRRHPARHDLIEIVTSRESEPEETSQMK